MTLSRFLWAPSSSPISGHLEEAPYTDAEVAWAEVQSSPGDVAAEIESTFVDDFSYAYFAESGEGEMVIGFKGKVPEAAADLLEGSGLSFDVREDNGYTWTQYDQQVTSVAEQLQALSDSETQYKVEPTFAEQSGSITITRVEEDADHARSPNTVSPPGIVVESPFELRYATSEEMFEPNSYGRAAGTWRVNDSGTGVCTSGFVVRSTSSSDFHRAVLACRLGAGRCCRARSEERCEGEHSESCRADLVLHWVGAFLGVRQTACN